MVRVYPEQQLHSIHDHLSGPHRKRLPQELHKRKIRTLIRLRHRTPQEFMTKMREMDSLEVPPDQPRLSVVVSMTP